VESLDTVIAPLEPGFPMPLAPAFYHSAVILSATKLSAQPCCPALSANKQQGDACNYKHPECND
jgi:hypothetical protein